MGKLNLFDHLSNAIDVVDHVSSAADYMKSERYRLERELIKKYEKKVDTLVAFFLILWLSMIIGTIVLCVSGNDIILRLLHV